MGLLILLAVAVMCIVATGTMAIILSMRYPPRKSYAVALGRGLATSPAEMGYEFTEEIFTFRDGAATPLWDIRGRGPVRRTVIITHGFGDSRYGALTWVPLLADFVGRIIVYDLRAHGDSTARAGGSTALESDDLMELIERLDLPDGVVLFGYSMGAVISICAAGRVAAEQQEKVRGVIADGPYRRPMEPVIGHLRLKRYPAYPFVWLVDAHLAFWYRRYRPFDRAKQASALACPLLVLHGTEDPICASASARAVAASARQGSIVEFPGGGHLDLAVCDRARYLEALGTFFDGAWKNDDEPRRPD